VRLYKRGIVWHGSYWTGGRRVRVSTRCTDKRAAEAHLRKLERRANGAGDAAPYPPHSVTDAISQFQASGMMDLATGTQRMYVEKGGHLVRLLGEVDVNELGLDQINQYITVRLSETAARSTVAKELVALRVALAHAKRRGVFFGDARAIIPKFRSRYVPRDRRLSEKEFDKLARTLLPHRRRWVMLAAFLGARTGEVEHLRWEDFDFRRRFVALPGTKTKQSRRVVPLPVNLVRALVKGRAKSGFVVGAWPNARRDLAAACKRVEVPRISPNDLRRTYASWLKNAGVDSAVVAKLLGHTSTRMVDAVYGHLDVTTLARAVARLPGAKIRSQVRNQQQRRPECHKDRKCGGDKTSDKTSGRTFAAAPGRSNKTEDGLSRSTATSTQASGTSFPVSGSSRRKKGRSDSGHRLSRPSSGSDAGVSHGRGRKKMNGRDGDFLDGKRVLGPGIEPGTRGFSVRCSTS